MTAQQPPEGINPNQLVSITLPAHLWQVVNMLIGMASSSLQEGLHLQLMQGMQRGRPVPVDEKREAAS